MNWQLFLTTFVTIFLAELGDKTQFAAVAASVESPDSTKEVLLAVVLALSTAGILGVVGGRLLASMFNPTIMRYVSGGMFLVVGLWVLLKKN